MIEFLSLEGISFYILISLITLGILYIAWISTAVNNQHSLTLVIWPARDPPRRIAFLHLLLENIIALNRMPMVLSDRSIFDELTSDNTANGETEEEGDESAGNSEDEIENGENTSTLQTPSQTIEEITSNVNLTPPNQISETNVDATTASKDTDSTTTDSPQTCCDESSDPHSEGVIRIKLKYLDDRQKTVIGNASQLILDFKRKFFNIELSEHRVVRLIFQGKLLKDDNLTLASYGIHDDSVVHCHISQPKPPVEPVPSNIPAQNETPSASRRRILLIADETQNAAAVAPQATRGLIENFTDGLDLSNFIVAVLWVVVGMLWFIRINHSHLFSSFSTLMLLFLTLLLIVPHYIMAVDVQLNVDLNNTTMRNLGIERIMILPQTPTIRSGDNRDLGSSSTNTSEQDNGEGISHIGNIESI